MVLEIGYVEVAVRPERRAKRRSGKTPFPQERTGRRKILDAAIVVIGDENVTITGYVYAVDFIELTVARPPRTPLAEDRTVGRKILNPRVVCIVTCHVHVAVPRESDS